MSKPQNYVVIDCAITVRKQRYPVGSVVTLTTAEREDVDPSGTILKHEAVVAAEKQADAFREQLLAEVKERLAEVEKQVAEITGAAKQAATDIVEEAKDSLKHDGKQAEGLFAKLKEKIFSGRDDAAEVRTQVDALKKELADVVAESKAVLDENTKVVTKAQALQKELAEATKVADEAKAEAKALREKLAEAEKAAKSKPSK